MKPFAYITNEAIGRLERGGNSKGTVPVHKNPSMVSSHALYSGDDVQRLCDALQRIITVASCAPHDNEVAADQEFSKIMRIAREALK